MMPSGTPDTEGHETALPVDYCTVVSTRASGSFSSTMFNLGHCDNMSLGGALLGHHDAQDPILHLRCNLPALDGLGELHPCLHKPKHKSMTVVTTF